MRIFLCTSAPYFGGEQSPGRPMGRKECKGRLCDHREASGLKRREALPGRNGLCPRCYNESERDAVLKSPLLPCCCCCYNFLSFNPYCCSSLDKDAPPPLRAESTKDQDQLALPSAGSRVVLIGDSVLQGKSQQGRKSIDRHEERKQKKQKERAVSTSSSSKDAKPLLCAPDVAVLTRAATMVLEAADILAAEIGVPAAALRT